MKPILLSALLLVLLFSSCIVEPLDPVDPVPVTRIDPTDTLPNLGQIHFNNMQIGQRSRYVYFYIPENSNLSDSIIDYRPDTVVVVVAAHDSEGYLMREFITRGSLAYDSTINQIVPGDSVLSYHLRIENDSLYIGNASLFWALTSRIFVLPDQSLPLAPITSPLTTFVGWQTTLPSSGTGYYVPGYVENFTHWGQTFDHLNIIWDSRQINADGGRFLFAYSLEHGLVRWAYRRSFVEEYGFGWDLLPE